MANFLLILICFVAGFVMRKTKVLQDGSHLGINAWIIYVALPAAALFYLPKITWSNDLWLPVLTPLICWIGAWVLTQSVQRYFKFDRPTRAGFLIVTGLGNTSFIGFPLISAYYGEEYLSIAAIVDQANFFLLAVFASFVAMKNEPGGNVSLKFILRKLVTFPPFFALPLAFVLPRYMDMTQIEPLFKTLAATLSPLAIFSVGIQFELKDLKSIWKPVAAASIYKLILSPILVLLLALLLNITGMPRTISVFEAGMGTMISAGILNDQFNLNPKLSNTIVFTTILLSFLTSGVLYGVMG
ncbi:hypothetical protein SAMN05216474_0281 [Lishizhenia tianjinensis]|uniref:AEC family transporter n=1 Tax=Lishizhenia tianjinensis TaxID=477690 RepID=A0A1I6XLM6_9FLAO|nr:AEC family transporter [Lishizhenia tianjinensis]SFT38921.1 hypothetical protein SAMN05216474_0281 [Lishizhenia tianjinensis]